MSIAGAGSAGTQVNRVLDALGYPDKFGDAIGALVDMKTGNIPGAVRNLVDLKSGLTTGQMDRMFGRADSSAALQAAFQAGNTPARTRNSTKRRDDRIMLDSQAQKMARASQGAGRT